MRFVSLLLITGFSVSVALAAPAVTTKTVPRGNPKSIALNEQASKAALAGDYKTAVSLLRQAIAIDPGNLTAVFNLSGLYLRDHLEGEAIELLEAYLTNAPDNPGLNARMGDALFATRKAKEAAGYYEKCLSLDPHYPGVASRLATIYTVSNRFPDAEKLMLQAVEQDPKNIQLFTNLSNIYLVNNKPDYAISTAKRGLQIKATPELYVTLGMAYERQQDIKNSIISFQRAQDLGDVRPEIKEKIAELQKLGENKEN